MRTGAKLSFRLGQSISSLGNNPLEVSWELEAEKWGFFCFFFFPFLSSFSTTPAVWWRLSQNGRWHGPTTWIGFAGTDPCMWEGAEKVQEDVLPLLSSLKFTWNVLWVIFCSSQIRRQRFGYWGQIWLRRSFFSKNKVGLALTFSSLSLFFF